MEHPQTTSQGWMRGNLAAGIIQLAFVVAVIAAAIGLSAILNNQVQKSAPRIADLRDSGAVSIRLAEIEEIDYRPQVRVNGTIQSSAEIAVSAQVSGEIKRVSPAFRAGNEVKKGDLLFEIDRADYLLTVQSAQAEVAAAKSDLQQLEAEAEIARREWEELYPGREVNELAARIPQIEAAKARLGSAEANKSTAELALRRTRVYAPSDARVIASTLDVGQIIAPNQSVGRMVSLDSIELVVPVSSEQLNILQPAMGREASFQVRGNANAELVDAKVVRVDVSLDARTRLTNLYLSPADQSALRIGDFVDVALVADRISDVAILPASALSGQDTVWVVENNKLRARTVTILGERMNGEELLAAPFDQADGVVSLPPIEAYDGLDVTVRDVPNEAAIASTSGVSTDGAQ
ncbi:MAG: efflux RND transporter periplasmic adaptor subunit [Pseudomonadota bacterium]